MSSALRDSWFLTFDCRGARATVPYITMGHAMGMSDFELLLHLRVVLVCCAPALHIAQRQVGNETFVHLGKE